MATPVFRVKSRIYNNRLIAAREAAGFKTSIAAARAIGIPAPALVGYETLHTKAWLVRHGRWAKAAQTIAAFFKTTCDELWPAELAAVTATTMVTWLDIPTSFLEAPRTPEELLLESETLHTLESSLDVLSPMERRVVDWRFGLADKDERTLIDIGNDYGLSRERIRQLECRALDKLKSRMEKGSKE